MTVTETYPVTKAHFTGAHEKGKVKSATIGMENDGTMLEVRILPIEVTRAIIKEGAVTPLLKKHDEDLYDEVIQGVLTFLFVSADEENNTLSLMLYREASQYNLQQFQFENVAQLRAVFGPWKSVTS